MDHTISLIRKSHHGDKEAREQLVKENVGLVWCVVKRFYGRGAEPEDLFQIGSIGLLKAIDKFDLSYDVQFSTYAVPMISVESIYRPIHQEGESQLSILDRLEEKSRPEEHLLNRMMLSQILDGLDKEERQLIYLRYFQEKTQAAVGEILGISQVQVSRMEKKILERMRKQM